MKDNQNDQTVQNNQKGQQNQTNPTSNQSGKIHEFEDFHCINLLKKQSDLEIEQPNKEEKEKNTPFDPKMQKDKIQPNEEIKTQTDENNKQPETVEKNAVGTDIVSENFTNPQKNKISENKDITNEDIQLDVTNKNDYKSKINY